jgi:hypothetical protein
VLALLLLAVGALLGGWRPFSSEPSVITFGASGDMARFALFEGECASGELGGSAGFGPENDAPCGEPHDVEVVGTRAPLGEGREVSYPGEDAMARFGRAYCAIVLDSAVVADAAAGVSKDDLDVTAVIPTQAAFDSPRTADASSSGARQVSCVISRSGGDKLGDRFSVI